MQFTFMASRVTLITAYEDELGVQLHDVGMTLWLARYRYDMEVLVTPDQTHILVPEVPNEILDVSALEAEAKAMMQHKGKRKEPDNWTDYQGKPISQPITTSNPIQTDQDQHILTVLTGVGYSRLNLATGEVLEHLSIFSHHDGWVLTQLDDDLHLLNLQTRQSFQLTKNCGIQAAYLNSRDSYCLIAAGGLVMYYLTQPFVPLNDATKSHTSQWKHFSLFDAEFIDQIVPTEKEYEYIIKLSNPENTEVRLHIKTGDYWFNN